MNVSASSITQTPAAPSTTSFPGSTSIIKIYPDSVRAICDPSVDPEIVFNATVPFKNKSPFCQFNFPYHLDGLQRCCGNKSENQAQVYQNCTQYCSLKDDKPETFESFQFCLEDALEKLGYNGGEMHKGVLCGKAEVQTSGEVSSAGSVGWFKEVMIVAALLVLVL